MDAKTLAQSFKLAFGAISANLQDINETDALWRPDTGGNCINWLCGHLLSARDGVAHVIGIKPYFQKSDLIAYERGGTPNAKDYLPWKGILEGLNYTAETLPPKIAELSTTQLQEQLAPSSFPVPVQVTTREALLQILLFHEGYHGGQIGLLRRLLGKIPIIK